jgi:hypothetical protein
MKSMLVVGLVISLASSPCFADCIAPAAAPEVPDGSTAGREAMMAALQAVKTYNVSVTAYVDCLRSTTHDTARIDIAVDRLTKIAERFNAELHAFKSKNGG